MNNKKPLIIAGPCSAESEEQLFAVAKGILEGGRIDLFRAGVWKPRTRPNSFEGLGETALPWLKNLQLSFEIPVMVEVANPKHVELALKYGINHLWVGARTTVSPFAVQEIANSIQGTKTSVYVKNPIHPEIELWVGAIERFLKADVHSVSAIHRGFSSFRNSNYRNIPMWEIPIELQRRFPDMALICDPSHIAGKREVVKEVSQRALDLGMAGLMVEVHPTPDSAMSDPNQQITPETFNELIKDLEIKAKTISDVFVINKLEELRSKIDKLDEDLIQILNSRMNLVKEIGEYKKDNGITVFQLERWNEILKTRSEFGDLLGLETDFVKQLMERIHSESIKTQIAQFQKEASKE